MAAFAPDAALLDPAERRRRVKQSGIGREGGQEGILEYLEATYVAVSW